MIHEQRIGRNGCRVERYCHFHFVRFHSHVLRQQHLAYFQILLHVDERTLRIVLAELYLKQVVALADTGFNGGSCYPTTL